MYLPTKEDNRSASLARAILVDVNDRKASATKFPKGVSCAPRVKGLLLLLQKNELA